MPAIPYKKCQMSSDAWDGGAQEKKLEATKANCRGMYAWVDPDGDEETKSAYKMPFHFVNDDGTPGEGSIKACQSIIGILNGAQGGADIPDSDREAIYNNVSKHLKDADLEPAPLKERSAKNMDSKSISDLKREMQNLLDELEEVQDENDSQEDSDDTKESVDEDKESDNEDSTEAETTEEDNGVEPSAEERSAEIHRGRDGKKLVRSVPKGSVRAVKLGDDGRPGVELQVLRYNVVDSYGSVWLPGCLTKGLEQRLPQLAWSHTWSDPIGRAMTFTDSSDGPFLPFYLDDFEAVPRAKQAYAQVNSGTIDDCSIGFGWDYLWRPPTEEELKRWPGCTEVIIEADLDEVSLVLRGAVPGAKVLTVRSSNARSAVIPKETAGQIMVQFAQGNISLLDALQSVQDAAMEPPEGMMDVSGTPGDYDNSQDDDRDDLEGNEEETEDDDDKVVTVTVTVPIAGDDEDDEELDQALLEALDKVSNL